MSDAPSITPTIFLLVGKRRFAFGLQWLSVTHETDLRNSARNDAMRMGASHIVYRKERGQYALANVTDRRPQDPFTQLVHPWYSAAASLAKAMPSAWVAAYVFQDGRAYVVACHGGKILPDGDLVFNDALAAKAHVEVLLRRPGWNAIYAPADWAIPNAKPHNLFSVLQAHHAGPLVFAHALSPKEFIKSLRHQPPAVLVLVVAVIGLGILVIFKPYKTKPGAIGPRTETSTQALQPLPRVPPGSEVIARCAQTTLQMLASISAPGWDGQIAVCNAQGITVTMRSQPYAPTSILVAYFPSAVTVDNGRTAEIRFPFEAPVIDAEIAEPTFAEDTYHDQLAQISETATGSQTFQRLPEAPNTVNNRPRYRLIDWTLTTRAPDLMWAPDLARLPNISIDLISASFANGVLTWSIKGKAYATP